MIVATISKAHLWYENYTKYFINFFPVKISFPWIPEAPRKTEKRDVWFREACSCFTHPIRSQYPDFGIFCDWSNLEYIKNFLEYIKNFFIEYIKNMMIPHDKKTLVSKQYEYWFFKVLCLCYKQGLRISTASCGLRKTN